MSAPQGLKPPAGARNRRKATVKIRRHWPLQILPLIQKFFSLNSYLRLKVYIFLFTRGGEVRGDIRPNFFII